LGKKEANTGSLKGTLGKEKGAHNTSKGQDGAEIRGWKNSRKMLKSPSSNAERDSLADRNETLNQEKKCKKDSQKKNRSFDRGGKTGDRGLQLSGQARLLRKNMLTENW